MGEWPHQQPNEQPNEQPHEQPIRQPEDHPSVLTSGQPRRPVKHPVLLVHGVCTRGAWQDDLTPLLQRFFEPVTVRYPHYRGPFGGLYVILEPWVLLGALAAIAAAYGLGWAPAGFAALAAAAAACFSMLPVVVEFRRRAALRALVRATNETLHQAPHVIAHSFGTYLTARLLVHLCAATFRQVILCGSVLPRNFDWSKWIVRGRVNGVRSDYTRSDRVGMLARIAGVFHANLGDSGSNGMDHRLTQMHKVAKPDAICEPCIQRASSAPIHDVDCSPMGHSEALLVPAHCRRWWLPFLWGFDPAEHCALLELSRDWVLASSRFDWKRSAELETGLRTRHWGWCNGETIWTHLCRAHAHVGLTQTGDDIVQTFNRLAVLLEKARMCEHDAAQVVYLEPNFAITTIVREAARAARREKPR